MSESGREAMIGANKKRWQESSDEERQIWIGKMRNDQKSSYTYPEILLMMIIDEYELPYKFVGDGSFWIENINPDFVNTNNEKIIIEVFGDYWHNRPDHIEKDFKKKELLDEYGWQRIVLWEHDLKESSFEDIANFIKTSKEVNCAG